MGNNSKDGNRGELAEHSRYLAYLCENEMNDRYQRRVAQYTKRAQLPSGK